MASADTISPARHLDERPRAERPRSPRRERGDTYRPGDRGRERERAPRDRSPPAQAERAPEPPVRTEEEKQAAAKAEYEKLLNMRSGGTYIPPARLRALQAQITDKTSKEYQRMAWEALKKSITGLINKANTANIKHIVPELFGENLIRGRGLFCQSITRAQAASLAFTPIYAAMAAIVNTKLPQVGELLCRRLVLRFRKAFRRNDKAVCLATTTFIAHLANQQVVHEILPAQILQLLLQKPTDDSVEIAVGLTREVGAHLEDMNPAIAMVVFDQFRNILHEADIDKRVQYMIEVLFQVRKDKFKDNPAVKEELDLIEEEDQITHRMELDGDYNAEDSLNIFKFDPEYEESEAAYKTLKAEILGEGSDYDDDDDEDDESSEGEGEEEQKAVEIKDQSNTDLVNLRRTIYLTLMSSANPEEATHKLMKISLPPGQEMELVSMIIECCAQERTYLRFFGLIGERFAKINRLWTDLFEQGFDKYYDTIHRYETNKLRNIARFFGHMLGTDAIGWHVLSIIHLNEEETTSASRIFIKILFQDIAELIGMQKLQARMKEDTLQPSFQGLFPHDNPRNIRFSINYFTSIGMGALTEEMREFLQNMPKPTLPAPAAAADRSDSESVSSYSSYTGSSYSSRSRSRTPPRRAIGVKRSPSPRSASRGRGRSDSRGRSYSRSVSGSRSPSPPPRRAVPPQQQQQRRAPSYSASPPPRRARGRRDDSYSRSPSRSLSRSRSPPPKPRGAPPRGRSLSKSPAPPPPRRRRNSSSDVSPPAKRRRPSYSASPPPRRGRRNSSSVSAAPRRIQRRDSYSASRSPSRSRSPPPAAASASAPAPPAAGRGRYRERSASPPRGGGGPPARGRANARRDESYSRSPSPPPPRRDVPAGGGRGGARGRPADSRSPSPGGKRRRRYSSSGSGSSRSRSPAPPPTKRGRVSN